NRRQFFAAVGDLDVPTAFAKNSDAPYISLYVNLLKKHNPNKIVVLADLDPEKCAPCITKRKEIIGSKNIDLVIIACKALESWFLADTEAMKSFTKQSDFFEENPEQTSSMPWTRIKEIGLETIGRGPGTSKIAFAEKFINIHQFNLARAAQHPNCPSAKYFVEKLRLLT
ncbi:MAG: hypothetical protein ACU84J_05235, partial [Gammaproteobacteria bacterium]